MNWNAFGVLSIMLCFKCWKIADLQSSYRATEWRDMSFVDLLFLENRENVPEVFQKQNLDMGHFWIFKIRTEWVKVFNSSIPLLSRHYRKRSSSRGRSGSRSKSRSPDGKRSKKDDRAANRDRDRNRKERSRSRERRRSRSRDRKRPARFVCNCEDTRPLIVCFLYLSRVC